jgi:thiamine-phosphate pyrophosphorylase
MTQPVGRLHVLTDVELQRRWTHLELARMAAAGGADVVQYRDKRQVPAAERLDTARAIRSALPPSVQLIVDDFAAVARDAGADGVHLGWDDLPHPQARAIVGVQTLVGGTANSLDEARRCFELPIDYIGAGPVFGTRSKTGAAPALGLDMLAQIARESPLPVIAIGGIRPEDVDAVLQAGAWGIAVLSGVALADAPQQATARYAEAIVRCLARVPAPEGR